MVCVRQKGRIDGRPANFTRQRLTMTYTASNALQNKEAEHALLLKAQRAYQSVYKPNPSFENPYTALVSESAEALASLRQQRVPAPVRDVRQPAAPATARATVSVPVVSRSTAVKADRLDFPAGGTTYFFYDQKVTIWKDAPPPFSKKGRAKAARALAEANKARAAASTATANTAPVNTAPVPTDNTAPAFNVIEINPAQHSAAPDNTINIPLPPPAPKSEPVKGPKLTTRILSGLNGLGARMSGFGKLSINSPVPTALKKRFQTMRPRRAVSMNWVGRLTSSFAALSRPLFTRFNKNHLIESTLKHPILTSIIILAVGETIVYKCPGHSALKILGAAAVAGLAALPPAMHVYGKVKKFFAARKTNPAPV